jgi:uncharacterized protein YkwD
VETASVNSELAPTPLARGRIQHSINPGETLLGLAVDYDVSMAAIQLANGMGGSIDLIAGQTILIPSDKQWLGESRFWVVHVVNQGQTLIGLSSDYGLTVEQILHVNAIADPDLIRPGQQLVIPLNQLVTLRAPQPTATAVVIAASSSGITNPIGDEPASTPTTSSDVEHAKVSDTSPTPMPAGNMPAGPADWSNYILAQINQARSEHGLNTLTLANELTRAAQFHAEDCAQRGWGSHVGSDGAVLKTRLERAGYVGRNWGENWVQAQNATRAFEWWYGEIPPNDPHRRNILSPYYTEVGIGIANTNWGYIFVTDFGRR